MPPRPHEAGGSCRFGADCRFLRTPAGCRFRHEEWHYNDARNKRERDQPPPGGKVFPPSYSDPRGNMNRQAAPGHRRDNTNRTYTPASVYNKPPPPQQKYTAGDSDEDSDGGMQSAVLKVRFRSRGRRPPISLPPFVRRLPWYNLPKELNKSLNIPDAFGMEAWQECDRVLQHTATNYLKNFSKRGAPRTTQQQLQLLHALEYVEDLQMQFDIRAYDIPDTQLEPANQSEVLWKIYCEGLAEKRPSVIRGDEISAKDLNGNAWHKGYVHFVNLDHVVVSFDDRHCNARDYYFVVFSAPRTQFRVRHEAIDNGYYIEADTIDSAPCRQMVTGKKDIEKFTTDLNEEQLAFVNDVAFPTSHIHLLHGPPGTGKTTSICACLNSLLWAGTKTWKILVCTPSNLSADLIVERVDAVVKRYRQLPARRMLRLNGLQRDPKTISETVKRYSNRVEVFPSREDIQRCDVVVTTLMTSGKLYGIGIDHFDVILIDEAAQATESDTLIPFTMSSEDTHIVLVGDHKQLGPVIRSRAAKRYQMERSALERLTNDTILGPKTIMLTKSYRAHPSIMGLYNPTYNNMLQSRGHHDLTHLLCRSSVFPGEHPILFHHCDGLEQQQSDSPSWMNLKEVGCVLTYVRQLLTDCPGINFSDIAILTPYSKQAAKIKGTLFVQFQRNQSPFLWPNGVPTKVLPIHVSSIEAYQGREAKVVILSTVRSMRCDLVADDERFGIGFLKQPQRLNVAVSRPICGFIIVGNAWLLSEADDEWRRIVHYFHGLRCMVPSNFDPNRRPEEIRKPPDAVDPAEAGQAAYVDREWRRLE